MRAGLMVTLHIGQQQKKMTQRFRGASVGDAPCSTQTHEAGQVQDVEIQRCCLVSGILSKQTAYHRFIPRIA